MGGTDKYVVIFAIGVIALVIVALVVTSTQPEKSYLEGDAPESVAHNYLLALEQGDYERAYGYLSPELKGYPADVRAFAQQIRRESWMFPTEENSAALTLLGVEQRDGWAEARVRMTATYGGGPFGLNRSTNEFELQLEQTDDGWKVVGGDRLFAYCWAAGNCN